MERKRKKGIIMIQIIFEINNSPDGGQKNPVP